MVQEIQQFAVEDSDAGTRLDVWLLARFEGQSRAGIQRWIKDGFVTRIAQDAKNTGVQPQTAGGAWSEFANAKGAPPPFTGKLPQGTVPTPILEANPAKKVRVGEVYHVDMPEIVASTLVGEDIPLNIVYEDDDLLVLDKAPGMTVHPAPGNFTGTMVQALIHHCGDSLSGINGEARPGIVHRIDKDTSGLLVVAKHDQAHRFLAKQFARHDIHRVYYALVRGVPLPMAGIIEGNIGRHPTNRIRRAVVTEGGKPAITHYKVLRHFGDAASMVECRLETGRTHQIRVHMAHIGHPLLGDPLYGNNKPLKGFGPLELPKRQLLHAAELGFVHPRTLKDRVFVSELPTDITQVIDLLSQ